MSELQLYKQPNLDLSQYSKREVEVFQALQSPMIKDVEDIKLFEAFRHVINKSYLMTVYTAPEPSQFTVIVDETMKMAKSKFGFVRLNELPLIFVRGCSKEFGEFMGLSFITFSDWFAGYIKDQTRIKFTTPVKEEKIPTLQERFEIARQNAMQAFLSYQVGKDISLVAPIVYRFLRGIKLFVYSDSEQEEFMSEAKINVLHQLKMQKEISLDKFKRLEIEKMINGEISFDDKVVLQAQRLGLYAYFQELILNESDLQELINQKKPSNTK